MRTIAARFVGISLLCASLILPFWGSATASAISAASESSPLRSPVLPDNLVDKAMAEGSVLVIVALALPQPFAPEAELSQRGVRAQRAAIAAAGDAVLSALAGQQAQVAATFTAIPSLALRVDAKALLTLAGLPQVTSIEEDVPVPASLGSSTGHLGLPAVWAGGVVGTGQTVVLLDTGIDTDHPFFANRLVDGACFSNAGGAGGYTTLCPNGSDLQLGLAGAESDSGNSACWNGAVSLCWHGSHVAGIAAGGGHNNLNGVAYGAGVIAIQIFTRFDNYAGCGSSACALTYTTDQLRALDYVYTTLSPAYPLAAVNMSLGGGQYSAPCDVDSRKPAIDNLRGAGVATVIAAGNNGYRNALSAPACISTAVAAGGVTDSDSPPTDAVLYNMHSLVDLLAPGRSVTSAYVGGAYATASGTSMAAPHVAGAFALCKSANPALGVGQIEAILEQTGVAVHDARSGGVHTRPRLQMDAAVAACQQVAIWTGAASSDWNNPANWSNNAVPSGATFANIPSQPAGGRFPVIAGSSMLRSLLLEAGSQVDLAGGAVTVNGSLEVAATAQLDSAGSTVILAGDPLATVALPPGQTLHDLQIGSGSDQVRVALGSNLALAGNLAVQPGATLDLATYGLTAEGNVANFGVLRQARSVTGGTVEFLHISDSAASASKYRGLDITPAASMGSTVVSVTGHQGCGAGDVEVQRCYDITPTTASVSDVTFYYQADEANGADGPAAYHWNGASWEGPLPGTAGGSGDFLFSTAAGVNAYSPFALLSDNPLAVMLESFAAQAQPGHVLLTWHTASEIDALGFTVLRSQSSRVEPEALSFVPAQGPGSGQGFSYAWQDYKVEPGATYWYWLEDIDLSGAVTRHGPVSVHYSLRGP